MTVAKAPRRLRAVRDDSEPRTSRPRRRRAKRGRPAASATPLPCVVLAVDTAARSGWAVLVGQDDYLAWGEADTLDEPALDHIVRWAAAQAQCRSLPLVLVLEQPWGGPMPIVLSLGGARERWLRAWRTCGFVNRVVSVQPAVWRAPVLGKGWARAPRDDVRRHEQGVAAMIVGERCRGDEAVAILVAKWAMRAAAVAQVLPRPAGRPR